MSTAKNNKNKLKKKYYEGYHLPDYVNYIFLTAIFGIYPIITHNKYFDITNTRYEFFVFAAGIYIFCMIIALIIENVISSYYGNNNFFIVREKQKFYAKPEFWLCAFLMANLFAFICAEDKKNAMSGDSGRHMGLFMFIIISAVFLLLAQRIKPNMILYMVFAAATVYAYIIAIYQHMGNDFMGYKEKISPKQYHIFISTFGNINIFASFLVISIPVFLCAFTFMKKLAYRVIAAVILFGGGMVIMIANSDSAYLGFTAAAVLIFFLAYKDGCVKRYIQAMLILAGGNLGVVLLNKLLIKEYDKRGGVAEALDRIDLAVAFIVILAILYLAVYLIERKFGDRLEAVNKKKAICVMLIILAVLIAVIVISGVLSGASLFTFNYKWGTYRGYIWTKCAELFNDAPAVNKIFGYGNETVKALMKMNYYEEMVMVTGKVYDNAHNELLQYLITTGIVGAVTYIGLFVSSFIYLIKNSNKMPIAYISLAVITGYFVQGLINLNQPITTPFYFVFMAVGIGYVRYRKSTEENLE